MCVRGVDLNRLLKNHWPGDPDHAVMALKNIKLMLRKRGGRRTLDMVTVDWIPCVRGAGMDEDQDHDRKRHVLQHADALGVVVRLLSVLCHPSSLGSECCSTVCLKHIKLLYLDGTVYFNKNKQRPIDAIWCMLA